MDLLVPHGKKHTGTGKSREYSIPEIRKAAILMELSRWKVPMPVFSDTFRTMVDEYENLVEWESAINAIDNVFLSLAWTEDDVNWQIAAGEPRLVAVTEPEFPGELDDYQNPFALPTSAMIINLSRKRVLCNYIRSFLNGLILLVYSLILVRQSGKI